jgi:hypothetical protein
MIEKLFVRLARAASVARSSIAALGADGYADRSAAAGGDAAIFGVLQGKLHVGQIGLSGTGGQP